MGNRFQTLLHRSMGAGLPKQEEIEQFGADGEEIVCRMLYESFDCVIRNVVVPHKELYLEKDFLVIVGGVPVVLEIKNWKGEIGCEGDKFYQNKDNGVHKTLKSPVGTTNQFIRRMKDFYGIERPVYGAVVFAEPDCTLSLPKEMDGVALIRATEMVAHLKAIARKADKKLPPVDPTRLLRCTRFYSDDKEYTKGILADNYLVCTNEKGDTVRIDTLRLQYLTVEHQPLRLRDKLYVTYTGGTTGVFYNRDAILTVACIDGSYRKIALNRIRHIVF